MITLQHPSNIDWKNQLAIEAAVKRHAEETLKELLSDSVFGGNKRRKILQKFVNSVLKEFRKRDVA